MILIDLILYLLFLVDKIECFVWFIKTNLVYQIETMKSILFISQTREIKEISRRDIR